MTQNHNHFDAFKHFTNVHVTRKLKPRYLDVHIVLYLSFVVNGSTMLN